MIVGISSHGKWNVAWLSLYEIFLLNTNHLLVRPRMSLILAAPSRNPCSSSIIESSKYRESTNEFSVQSQNSSILKYQRVRRSIQGLEEVFKG